MKRILVMIIAVTLLPCFIFANSILVKQTDYNCIPASIEMCYKILGDNDNSQYKIRREMNVPDGVIPVNKVESYLYENFIYTTKTICCVDSLINSIDEHPVLLILDMQKLEFTRNYNGHALVAVEYEDGYIKVLDPDGGVENWYYAKSVHKALKGWNSYAYIIKKIK